ncbi:hypothetical protein AB0D49_08385 [Streptomyces sp. NPDC048290]|uniref:hypothetical protein n=1 Tax=Streptomyces sp. NPDC048290 TaxID=3155811 RepID=UPI003448D551
MTSPSYAPRGEHTPAPGVTWEQYLVRGEQLVDDAAPDPWPNRATRRALQRTPQGAAMHCRVVAAVIARTLTAQGHTNALTGPSWQPGHRATQASPTTARVWHDGPDETDHLDQYANALRAAGYTVTTERAAGRRPSLRISRQKEK